MNVISATSASAISVSSFTSGASGDNAGAFGSLLDRLESQSGSVSEQFSGAALSGSMANISWFVAEGRFAESETAGGASATKQENVAAAGCHIHTSSGDYTFEAATLNGKCDISGTFGNGDGAFSAHLDANGTTSIEVLARADGGSGNCSGNDKTLAMLFAQITENMIENLNGDDGKCGHHHQHHKHMTPETDKTSSTQGADTQIAPATANS